MLSFASVVTRKTGALVDFLITPKSLEKIMKLFMMRDLRLTKGALAKNLSKKLNFLNYI